MYVYCLFCEAGKSRYVTREAEARFGCVTVSPRQIQHTWSRGKMRDFERELLPGYVFLYFQDEKADPIRLKAMQGVIRCLWDSAQVPELRGQDEQFALMLLERNGTIGKTQVWQEDDRLRICDGVFAGLEARILKVDRRASRMQVEIPFARQPVKTWLEYEIINRTPAGPAQTTKTQE